MKNLLIYKISIKQNQCQCRQRLSTAATILCCPGGIIRRKDGSGRSLHASAYSRQYNYNIFEVFFYKMTKLLFFASPYHKFTAHYLWG